ncbi:MAG TPA: ATP-binding protein [Ignavibacteria bacterium]|nr:ATP-binding protein [Ignavibacteria bacterium]HMR00238.1 ATP-binding protein [Ignavibacteria bacterium]
MKPIENTNARPSKRIYRSIISDYDLNKTICELIDNVLDIWIRNGKINSVLINIKINTTQQTIRVQDNAGGLKLEDLKYIVAPGYSLNKPGDEVIGFFGVGSKRAVVAIAEEIRIYTRFLKEKSYMINYNDQWLENDDDWELPTFEVENIDEGTTIIELFKLRYQVTEKMVEQLIEHLEIVYAKYLDTKNLEIKINDTILEAITFEKWSY